MIHKVRGLEAFGLLEELIGGLSVAPGYRALFELALGRVKKSAECSPIFPPVDLPLTAAEALGVRKDLGPLSAALSTLVWVGADLLDDGADGQLGEHWTGVSPHQVALVATNILSTLPHTLVVRQLGAGPEAATYSQALARTLLTMSEGQWVDLGSPATVTSIDEYIGLIQRKSGSEFALFSATPAILEASERRVVADWMAFGMAYGVMLQAFSDSNSVRNRGGRSDLLGGKRSLPVLHCLSLKSGPRHQAFVEKLDMASQGDHSAVGLVVEMMEEAGSLRFAAGRCELMRLRAAEALPIGLANLPMDHAARVLLRAYS